MTKRTRLPGLSALERATYAYLKRLNRRLERTHFHSLSELKTALGCTADSALADFVLHASELAGKTRPR